MKTLRPVLTIPVLSACLAGSFLPQRLHADGCCGGAVSAGSSISSHGTLQQLFGGSASRVLLLENNSASHSVDFQLGGKTVSLQTSESKRRDFGGAEPATASVPPLPGEGMAAKLKNSSGNSGSNNNVTVTEEDDCPPKYAYYDSTTPSGWEPAERRATLTLPSTGNITPGLTLRTAVSTRGDGAAPVPSLVDLHDFGYGGGVLSPGAVTLDNSSAIVVSKPGPMIAASLGHSTDGGPGRLGYIIPAATGTGGVYVFNERISYTVRGVDVSATTYTNGSGTGSVTRWKTANGLAVLTQTSSDVLTFTFYAPGSFSTSSPYAPNGGATPVRTMTVESLASGANPDNTKYSLGGKVTLSRPGRADQTRTMWWNNSTSVLNAYTSLSTGEVIVTASTVPGSPPVRDVDTTVTETFTDASGASKTLTRRTRDSVRSLKDGEEQVESHKLFLTNSTPGLPSPPPTIIFRTPPMPLTAAPCTAARNPPAHGRFISSMCMIGKKAGVKPSPSMAGRTPRPRPWRT